MKKYEKKSRNSDNNKLENKTLNYLKILKQLSKYNEDENKNITTNESKLYLKSFNEGNTISYKTKDYSTNFKKFKILQNPTKSIINNKLKYNNTEFRVRSGELTKRKKLIFQEYLSLTNKVKKMRTILFGNNQNEKSIYTNSNFIDTNNNNFNINNKTVFKKNIKNIIKSRYRKYRSKYIALSNDISNESSYKYNKENSKNNKTKIESPSNNLINNNINGSNKDLSYVKKYQKRNINSSINNNKMRRYIINNKTVIRNKINDNLYENKTHIDLKLKSTSNSRNKIKKINYYFHKTFENLELSQTFNPIYTSKANKSNSKNKNKKIDLNKCLTLGKNLNSIKIKKQGGLKKNNSISLIIKKSSNKKNNNDELKNPLESSKEKRIIQAQRLKKVLKLSPKNNDNKNLSYNSNIKRKNYTKKNSINSGNKIINNNTFNTVYNIYKINNTIPKNDCLPKNKEIKQKRIHHKSISSAIDKNNYEKIKKTKKNEKFKYIEVPRELAESFKKKAVKHYKQIVINKNKIHIKNISNIEILYLLESKINSIINKIKNYDICFKECQDWILYYFDYNIYNLIINLFNNKRNKINITNKIKIEILCYFLCYDSSFSKNFSQAGILLKTIFHLLNNNFLLLILYKINNIKEINEKKNYYNYCLMNNFNNIINIKLKINLSRQEIQNENCIIEIIEQNYKHINNYYKMLIDNLYNDFSLFSSSSSPNHDIKNNKIYKFPQCLKLNLDNINDSQKSCISSLFFIDTYKLLNNYNILDLKLFFDLFLKREKNINNSKNINSNPRLMTFQKSKRNNNKINYNYKYFLSPIKSCYKYTLLINLNILVYYKELNTNNISTFNYNINDKKKIIIRPGLVEFLEQMKEIYELIIFSNNSLQYILKIIKSFENYDKYFKHILSNDQISFNKNGSIKDLNLLGRNLKQVIIIDNDRNIFKLNPENENIIYVKPFYGDINNDGKILNNLSYILKKIRYEVEDYDNIKGSIKKHKLDIFTKISTFLL